MLQTVHKWSLFAAFCSKVHSIRDLAKCLEFANCAHYVYFVPQELVKTQTALRNLIQRNRHLPVELLAARNKDAQKGPTALQLPFILIQVALVLAVLLILPSPCR